METIYKSIHTIDRTEGKAEAKTNIPDEFETYIVKLLEYVRNAKNAKAYHIHDRNTTVIQCICKIAEEYEDQSGEKLSTYTASIADKLLREEQKVQEKIEMTGQSVKKGSLLQALLKDEDRFYYILAKIEHREWFDGESLEKSFGFPNDERKAWKTTIVPFTLQNKQPIFGELRVYTENAAKYWARDFMEIDEEKTDADNTKAVYKEIEHVLLKSVKKISPSDYMTLLGTLATELKKEQMITYSELIDRMVGDKYQADSEEVDTQKLKNELQKLPEAKCFDTNFQTVPSSIPKQKLKKKFTPVNGVDLMIDMEKNTYRDNIRAKKDANGKQILEIRCLDTVTFQTFDYKS